MTERFDKFTERARKVLQLAQEEAQRFNHNYIGTEHILLGLVREGDGVAARVLYNLGIELPKARSSVEFIIGRGDRMVMGEIGLTPRARRVIELAVDEARRLNHHYIGTEHMLLGLIREGNGIGAGVLESLGVSMENVRANVLDVLNSSRGYSSSRQFRAPGSDWQAILVAPTPAQDLVEPSDDELAEWDKYTVEPPEILSARINKILDREGLATDDPWRRQLEEICGAAPFTREEEDALIEKMKAERQALADFESRTRIMGENPITPVEFRKLVTGVEDALRQGEGAIGALMLAGQRLMVSIARRYAGRGVPFLTLIQAGYTGLLRAGALFDATRGRSFTSHAALWVSRTMASAVAGRAPSPRRFPYLSEYDLPSHGQPWLAGVQSWLGKRRASSPPASGPPTETFDWFTESARLVLHLAHEEAQRLGHNYIGTEHILLGLVRQVHSIAAQVLRSFDLNLLKVRLTVELLIKRGGRKPPDEAGLTAHARRALEVAVEEARRLGHSYIGTEHLLLGLLDDDESIAAGVLWSVGLPLDEARVRVIALMVSLGSGAAESSRPKFQDQGVEGSGTTSRARLVSWFERYKTLMEDPSSPFSEQERQILRLRFGLEGGPRTVEQLAGELGTPERTIQEIEQRLIHELKSADPGRVDLTSFLDPSESPGEELTPEPLQAPALDFANFTEQARKVFEYSDEEAKLLSHVNIGTEHLLLALLREEDSIAGRVLNGLGLHLDKVRKAVEFIRGRGDPWKVGDGGLTPRAGRVIELSMSEARSLNHNHVGTEHILLGLLRAGEGIAIGVLESLGAPLETVRAKVIEGLISGEDAGEGR